MNEHHGDDEHDADVVRDSRQWRAAGAMLTYTVWAYEPPCCTVPAPFSPTVDDQYGTVARHNTRLH